MAIFTPPINRNAFLFVKNSNPGPIPIGRGVILTGNIDTDGSLLIRGPLGADSPIHGVTYEDVPDDTTVGKMLQAGMSNVKVRIGATSVAFGDFLHIQDNTGVWEKAPAASSNCYYSALQAGAAGSLIWAAPLLSRPL